MGARNAIPAAMAMGLVLVLPAAGQTVGGDAVKWHRVTVDFAGEAFSETDGAWPGGGTGPNPFLDRRLDVTFRHAATNTTYVVPGYFSGDGAGGATGNVWRANFNPDQAGEWTYSAAYRTGANVAVADIAALGSFATGAIHGQTGAFSVAGLKNDAPGFKAKGRLAYAPDQGRGSHYLRFGEGSYFLKSGMNSPENFLGYQGFDDTRHGGDGVFHTYAPHIADYADADPSWNSNSTTMTDDNDAKGIVGAINYLSSRHVNSIYFLPMNIGGDGRDAYPFLDRGTGSSGKLNLSGSTGNDNVHYDLSKLEQWEKLFSHAQDKGILLHVVLNEAEIANKNELDNATLGVERKLFYREMIARFGHHNALQWNISEEYNGALDLTPARVLEFAGFIKSVDPYDHPIAVHSTEPAETRLLNPFKGKPAIDVLSIQENKQLDQMGALFEKVRFDTLKAGKRLPANSDEGPHPNIYGVQVGDGFFALSANSAGTLEQRRVDTARRAFTWDVYLSGGGIEWYFENHDRHVENFGNIGGLGTEVDRLWKETYYARKFLEQNTRFWEMDSIMVQEADGTYRHVVATDNAYVSADTLVRNERNTDGGAEVMFLAGSTYAVFLPDGSQVAELNLSGFADKQFLLRWYNPRTGEFAPGTLTLAGGGWVSLGGTPDGAGNTNDWTALVTSIPEPAGLLGLAPGIVAAASRRRSN